MFLSLYRNQNINDMKAILIDVKNETVCEVQLDKKNILHSWYKEIGCQMVEVAHYFNEMDCVMVDEEGLFTMSEDSKFFSVEGGRQPFIGNGLVVGCEPRSGESANPGISVEEVKALVKFHTLSEVRRMS